MQTTHPTAKRGTAITTKHGSTATTVRGVLSYMRAKGLRFTRAARAFDKDGYIVHRLLDTAPVGACVAMRDTRIPGYTRRTLVDAAASDAAFDSVVAKNPRKKNVYRGGPEVSGGVLQETWETINYRGRFKGYQGSSVTSHYQSCVAVSDSGRSAVVVTGCEIKRRLKAPEGMLFRVDNGVKLVRKSDGMDYHPTPEDFAAKDFATRVRRSMAENHKRRVAQHRAEKLAARDKKEAARIAKIMERDIPNVRVSLDDSRRAGNCVEGSLVFAERKLGLTREEVLSAGYLFSVPAKRLLSVANGDRSKVESAVRVAWMRETMVSI